MHTTTLALESNLYASIVYLMVSQLFMVAYVRGVRPYWVPFGAGWALLQSVFYAMLAITAGPDPAIDRTTLALGIRVVNVSASTLLAITAIAWAAQMAIFVAPRWRKGLGL
jgi:hypothetical protein